MASRTSVATLILVAVVLCIGVANGARDTAAVRRSTLAGQNIPAGWYYTLKPKNGSWCGLRDFPPYGGYGASRLYCVFPTYNHYWMWRVIKASGGNTISSGDEVLLYIHNPMPYKYCQLKSNVMCGYSNGTRFVIEKASGASGIIDFTKDDIRLKVGSSYCRLVGSGHAQQLTCAASQTTATVFQVLASSFVHTQLINRNTTKPCGAFFYGSNQPLPDTVTCTTPTFVGFTVNGTVALQQPGTPLVVAGANITFKAYDDFYTYHVATWQMRGNNVTYGLEETQSPTQWFSLERVSGLPTGGEVLNGTVVALKSASNGLYCGMATRNSTALVCDQRGSVASLPSGYTYTYVIKS